MKLLRAINVGRNNPSLTCDNKPKNIVIESNVTLHKNKSVNTQPVDNDLDQWKSVREKIRIKESNNEIPCCLCGKDPDYFFRTPSMSMYLCNTCFQCRKETLIRYPNWSVIETRSYIDNLPDTGYLSNIKDNIVYPVQRFLGY